MLCLYKVCICFCIVYLFVVNKDSKSSDNTFYIILIITPSQSPQWPVADSVAMVLGCSFPDVLFSPVQHGVGKVRLRLMSHSLLKVGPLLLF